MMFWPTKLKTIVSLASGVASNYALGGKVYVQCMIAIEYGPNGELIRQSGCPQPTWLQHAFDSGPLFISLIIALLVYLIWSLIQKKRVKVQ